MTDAAFKIIKDLLVNRTDNLYEFVWKFYSEKMIAGTGGLASKKSLLKTNQVSRLLQENRKHTKWQTYDDQMKKFIEKQVGRDSKKDGKHWQLFGVDLVELLKSSLKDKKIDDQKFFGQWRDDVSELASQVRVDSNVADELENFSWAGLSPDQQSELTLLCSKEIVKRLAVFHRIHSEPQVWKKFTNQMQKGEPK